MPRGCLFDSMPNDRQRRRAARAPTPDLEDAGHEGLVEPPPQQRDSPPQLTSAARTPLTASTPRPDDDDDSFHSVEAWKTPQKTPPRPRTTNDDASSYRRRFKELQKHARELVRRQAELEAELVETRADLTETRAELDRAREVSDSSEAAPYERPLRCEIHAALEAERYRRTAAEDEVRRLSLALRVLKDVKHVNVARRRRRSGRALSRALLLRAAAARGVDAPEPYELDDEVVDDGWLLGRLGARGGDGTVETISLSDGRLGARGGGDRTVETVSLPEDGDDAGDLSDDSFWIDINVDVVDVHASPAKVRRSPAKAWRSPRSDLLVAGDGLLRKARTLISGKASSPARGAPLSPERRPFARPWRQPAAHAITQPVAAHATGPVALDANAVAGVLSGLGPAYAAPAKTLRDASCDGAFLNTLSAAGLAATLGDVGLSPIQARRARHALGLFPCSGASSTPYSRPLPL